MNCRHISRLLSAYIDGELTGVEMLEIRRHLDACRSCNLQYESLRYTKQLLSHLAYAEPRPGLDKRICARLESIEIPAYQKLWGRVFSYVRQRMTPVAAGCAALGAMLVVLVSTATHESDVIAVSDRAVYTTALQLPTQPRAPFGIVPVETRSPQPLVPDTIPVETLETRNSSIFSFASFETP